MKPLYSINDVVYIKKYSSLGSFVISNIWTYSRTNTFSYRIVSMKTKETYEFFENELYIPCSFELAMEEFK